MAKISGTQVNVGLGIESTPGTPVAATIFPQWTELSLQAVSEKSLFNSQRGKRNMASNSQIRRRYSQGTIAAIANIETAAYFFDMALGSKATTGPTDSAYTHTFSVQNTNVSMKTATILLERGAEVTERFANCVCNSLNFEVSDDFATMSMDIIGGFPDTGTVTESFTQETEFAYHQMTAKFGTSFSNAAGQSATPLKAFSLTINNNVLLDEAFLSGANTPVAGGIIPERLQITGSYTLQFSGTTELDKYKANTLNALQVQFVGSLIGSASLETITIKLADLVLTSPPVEVNLDGLVLLTQEFEVQFDATDSEISVVVINDNAGAGY